ncbi:hypothetical protein NN561_019018 [Cricetulus griseus]
MQQPPSPPSRGRVAVTQPVPGRRSAPKLSPGQQPDFGELWRTEPSSPRRRASRHPGRDPLPSRLLPRAVTPAHRRDVAEGGESSAGAVGATRDPAPTAPRRPTRAVSSDFQAWEATVGKVHPWRPSFLLVVTRAGRRWPGAITSIISPGGTDSDA